MGSIRGSAVRREHRGPVAALLLLASVAPIHAVAQTALTPAAVEAMADRHFGNAREAGGAALVTIVKDGQIVFAKGYGAANPKTGTIGHGSRSTRFRWRCSPCSRRWSIGS